MKEDITKIINTINGIRRIPYILAITIMFNREEDLTQLMAKTLMNVSQDIYSFKFKKHYEPEAIKIRDKYNRIINKPNFGIGSGTWRNILKDIDVKSITLVGICTDICVISNALSLKIAYPEIPVRVIERLCMGVTKKSHEDAIATMKMCQVDII